jgi:hypothetical protein
VPGRHLILRCEAPVLRDRALLGYGVPLAGLLAGALIGAWVASQFWLTAGANVLVACGALAGTLLGVLGSKRVLQPLPTLQLLEVINGSGEGQSSPCPGAPTS